MREYALRDPEEGMIYPYGPGDPEPTLENAQKAVREAAKEFGVTLEIVWRDVTEWAELD